MKMTDEERKLRRKAYMKAYRQTPEHKALRQAYLQTPEYKASRKASRQTPEYKAKDEARRQTPEYKAYMKAYMKARHKAEQQQAAARNYMTALEAAQDFIKAMETKPKTTKKKKP